MATAKWIVGITFLVAFVLTFWRGRQVAQTAAAMFCVGTLAQLGALADRYFEIWVINSGSNDVAAVLGLFVAVWCVCYALGAAALLWPAIPQRKAVIFGYWLHLVFLLPLLIFFMVGIMEHVYRFFPFEIGWLVYPLLWFRIREAYVREA
ncbi:MAG TPA: hypothetical protein VL527_08955 [Dongiaceae bacterium]|nr:hypothetical protein [Dongiaceae bacterium]